MIDINRIINMEILKARMSGMSDLATELLEISQKGKMFQNGLKAEKK